MSLSFKLISSVSELSSLYAPISSLFKSAFLKDLSQDVWEWAYLRNPFGSPRVALAYDNDVLVGHYATIPINLVSYSGDRLCSHLSMTTMIDKKYVRYGLFQLLAEHVYDSLNDLNIDFVYGYPNSNSKPGFKKRLGWQVDDLQLSSFCSRSDYIASSQYQNYYHSRDSFTIDLLNDKALEWRMMKPGLKYYISDGAVYKLYGEQPDLMFISSRSEFESTSCDFSFNAICSQSDGSASDSIDYSFGYKKIINTNNLSFYSQLFSSDIF